MYLTLIDPRRAVLTMTDPQKLALTRTPLSRSLSCPAINKTTPLKILYTTPTHGTSVVCGETQISIKK